MLTVMVLQVKKYKRKNCTEVLWREEMHKGNEPRRESWHERLASSLSHFCKHIDFKRNPLNIPNQPLHCTLHEQFQKGQNDDK